MLTDETITPTGETTEPTGEATEPTGEATQPTGEATEPTGEATEPTGEATEPTGEATEPTGEATEPTGEATEPTGEATEPTGETTEPTGESTEPTEESTEPTEPEESFSCYTLGANEERLNGYWSEKDSNWYLFLTSTQDVKDTVIYYTGDIEKASAGQLNAEDQTVTGAFSANGDQVELTDSDGKAIHVTVMQSQLPSVYITLDGTTLDEVHAGSKDVKYPGSSITIMDPNGDYDLTAENSVEFKGRGNSTWTFFQKKGYQIKFDSKTSVLGMGKAKKWVLLANAADETLMHNMLAFDLASQMDMKYVTDFAYVDLWIDGEYRGNYTIGEKAEIGSSRLDLEDPYGTLFEQDQGFYYEEDYYFVCRPMRKYFTVKETNVDDSNREEVQVVMDAFEKDLDALAEYLYSTPAEEVTLAELETMIDVDSIAKYYLINEYTCNTESTAGSFYWYKDGLEDVMHVGPVWDFDSSMGNEKSNVAYYMKSHVLFNCLLASPAFYNRTVELYKQYKPAFDAMSSKAETFKEQISDSIDMNYARWDVWGKANPKKTLKDYSASYEEGFTKLTSWLDSRKDSFQVQDSQLAFTKVDEKSTTLEIFFKDADYSRVDFSVWSDNDAQNDLKNYRAEKNADGLWYYPVDLSVHQSTGKYTISVFSVENGKRNKEAMAYAYVPITNAPSVSAKLSEDNQSIQIVLGSVGSYADISIDVWCEANGNGDLVKYSATKQKDSTMTCTVNLFDHKEAGIYQIQVHGMKDGASVLIGETSVDAQKGTWPVETTEMSGENAMTLTLKNTGSAADIKFKVWKENKGEENALWFDATKQEDGSWQCEVNLLDLGEEGTYQIVAYGTKDGGQVRIASWSADVQGIVFPPVAMVIYRLYNPFTNEHLYTGSEAEKDSLVAAGWTLDGNAWNAPLSGELVYRLYNPYDDWHSYSMSQEEIVAMKSRGWKVDGVVCCSTSDQDSIPIYRLFNPYEQKNYHLLTVSAEEKDYLLSLGWKLDGVAFNATRKGQ